MDGIHSQAYLISGPSYSSKTILLAVNKNVMQHFWLEVASSMRIFQLYFFHRHIWFHHF